MADGDGWDLTGIPRWMWPYVRPSAENTAVSIFASAVSLRLIGARIGGETGGALERAAADIVADWEDDWCGTKPHPHPGQILETAAGLAAFANQLSEKSELRAGLFEIAGSLASKAFGPSIAVQETVTVG